MYEFNFSFSVSHIRQAFKYLQFKGPTIDKILTLYEKPWYIYKKNSKIGQVTVIIVLDIHGKSFGCMFEHMFVNHF